MFTIPIIVSLIVTGLIILPAFNIFYNSFTSIGFGKNVGFTLVNYITAFNDPEFGYLFFNSFIFALGTSTLSVAFATILAWIVTRTDTPLRWFTEFIPIIPLLFPPMLKNIAWIYLLAPRSGILNGFLSDIFGRRVTIFNAFSLPGMIWVHGIASIPTAYLLIIPAFLLLDPSLEESAYLSGAGTLKTFLKITLPLAFPSIFSSFILLLIRGLGSFETPVLQGIPAGFYVFMSKVYDAIDMEFNPGLATAYASILIVITMSLVGIYTWATKRSEKFATVIGKGYNPRTIKLGRTRYITLSFVLAYLIIAMILPYGVVIVTSVLPYFDYEAFMNVGKVFTWDNYIRILNHPTFKRGIINSFMLGIAASVITVPICALMAYVIHRGRGTGKKIFEFTGTLPTGFPGMLLGLGLLWSYFGTPFYGSMWGILLGFVIVYTPYGLRTLSAALIRIHKELEEAANIHGASWLYSFRRITLPLLKVALFTAFFYIFIQTHRRLGVVVLLSGPGIEVAPTAIFNYYNVGQWGETAAASLIYLTILLTYVLIAKYALNIKFRL